MVQAHNALCIGVTTQTEFQTMLHLRTNMTSVVYVCKSSNDTENGTRENGTRENGTRENDTGIGLRNRDLGKQSVQKVLLCRYVSDVVHIV